MNTKTLIAIAAFAAAFTARAVDWEGDWGFTYVTVGESYIGAAIVGYKGTDTEVIVPSQVTSQVPPYDQLDVLRVGGLGGKAFTQVTLPETVVAIDDNAFNGCTQLESINLPDSIETIGASAFNACWALESVIIPPEVTTLLPSAFQDCRALTSVDLSNVKDIGKRAFSSCAVLPEIDVSSVTNIGDEAFMGCTSFTTFTFPDCIKELPAAVLRGCSSLESVEYADDITVISYWTFSGCSSLKSIKIPSTVTVIGGRAFEQAKDPMDVHITDLAHWCCGIRFDDNPLPGGHLYLNGVLVTDLVIPAGVKYINAGAFNNVQDFVSITLPEGLERLEQSQFGAGVFERCGSVTNVVIPSTLKYSGGSAFGWLGRPMTVRINDLAKYCNIEFVNDASTPFHHGHDENRLILNGEEVRDMVIPSSAENVTGFAFYNCRRLTSVTFEGDVDQIGYMAFETCNQMTSVTFKASVDTIDARAFNGAGRIRAVNIPDVQSWCQINFAHDASNPLCPNSNNSELLVNGELVTDIDVTGGVGQYAFYYYKRLKSAKISGEGEIEQYAFRGCRGLTSVEIGEGIGVVGKEAFRDAGALTLLRMDNSVTNLVSDAFYDCNGLRRVSTPPVVSSIQSSFTGYWNPLPHTVITDVEIVPGEYEDKMGPQAIIAISNQFLTGCSSLKTVTIPKCIGSLESEVFAYEKCPSLRTVYVAEGCSDLLMQDIRTALSARQDVDLVFYGDCDLPVLLPDATAEQIAAALGEFVDASVTNKVTTWSEYMDFRQWVMTVKDSGGKFVGSDGVRASPYAWVSYALASETLLVKAITEDDLRVTSFVQDTNSVQHMSFDMSAAIKDVTPGASAKPAYLAEIFGVKGDDELKPSQFSEDDLSTTFSSPVQGELMLNTTVTKDSDQFFMKMKVR